MFDLLHKWKKFLCQKRHEYLLKDLNAAIYSKYKIGKASELGKPLFKGNKTDESAFKDYFKTYHFEKNFYTNYHAIHKLFDTEYQLINIPKKFCVYDIACGPYTATISLLNFLEKNNSLKGRAFSFTLCDQGDLTLDLLYQAAKENSDLFFPIPYFVQIRSEFDVNDWNISINQCHDAKKYGCRHYSDINIKEKENHDNINEDGINLILCSYVGKRGEKKFFDCIEKTFAGFSPHQKTYPTYIIYSHYIKKNEDEKEIKKAVEKEIKDIKSFSVSDVIQSNKPVPFPNDYYLICKIDSKIQFVSRVSGA